MTGASPGADMTPCCSFDYIAQLYLHPVTPKQIRARGMLHKFFLPKEVKGRSVFRPSACIIYPVVVVVIAARPRHIHSQKRLQIQAKCMRYARMERC